MFSHVTGVSRSTVLPSPVDHDQACNAVRAERKGQTVIHTSKDLYCLITRLELFTGKYFDPTTPEGVADAQAFEKVIERVKKQKDVVATEETLAKLQNQTQQRRRK